MSHSTNEGRLLSGQASVLSEQWFRATDRHVGRRSAGRRQILLEPGPPLGDLSARQVLEDLAGDVALQDADDLALRAPLLGPAFHVLAGGRIERETGHDDAPQGLVGDRKSTRL